MANGVTMCGKNRSLYSSERVSHTISQREIGQALSRYI